MKDEDKKLIRTFETRLRQLIDLNDGLKRENAGLNQLLQSEKEENIRIRTDLERLQTDYANLKTATAISSLNGSDVRETKLRLSKLVREVDKCIALLKET